MSESALSFKKVRTWYKKFQVSQSPQMDLVWGFFLYASLGFVLLSLPIFHKQSVGWLDNLFIATSAISTTGLVTVSVYDSYNFVGQLIVMILFQIGGIGYMTLTTYYLLFTTNRITRVGIPGSSELASPCPKPLKSKISSKA